MYNRNIRRIIGKVVKGLRQYSNRVNEKEIQKKLFIAALIGVLPFLYYAIIGYFDGTNITAQDYEIGAVFYNFRNASRTPIVIAITRLADFETQVLVTAAVTLFLIIVKKWKTGLWYGLMVLFGSGFLNGGVKSFYARVRPDQIDHLIEQGGYAFPSGHSMGSMIVYGGILFLILRYIKSKRGQLSWEKWVLGLLFGLLILSIGLSRIYLGVHYPSDVIGGFSLGFSWLLFSFGLLGLRFTREEFRPRSKYRF